MSERPANATTAKGKERPSPKRHPAESDRQSAEQATLRERMGHIRNKVLVMSGKGGVGKSTIAVQLALGLSRAGKKVGLLDVDIHGPSIPHLLGLVGFVPEQIGGTILPIECDGMSVMSIAFFLERRETPVIWRGPLKANIIKQFLKDVEWGELDYLIIDSPPGTGDEPLSVVQLVPEATGAVVVTTPQELALIDVRKAVVFCRQVKLPILGVVENMSGLVCPHCGEGISIFGAGGGRKMAGEMGVPFLGSVPFDPAMVRSADRGRLDDALRENKEMQEAFAGIVQPLLDNN